MQPWSTWATYELTAKKPRQVTRTVECNKSVSFYEHSPHHICALYRHKIDTIFKYLTICNRVHGLLSLIDRGRGPMTIERLNLLKHDPRYYSKCQFFDFYAISPCQVSWPKTQTRDWEEHWTKKGDQRGCRSSYRRWQPTARFNASLIKQPWRSSSSRRSWCSIATWLHSRLQHQYRRAEGLPFRHPVVVGSCAVPRSDWIAAYNSRTGRCRA